ncbi:hypothetical protein [uncultured Anaerococcus sp.]|uniref:hypothetical protein n=1 Tax=uncultured Anaerococcus sp. TaxID=293428 RepID=UPI0026240AF7|nr:hypothetical protein [uncultured Anaerococcus sp.]
MNSLIKYNLKSNRKLIARITIIHLIFIILAFIGRNIITQSGLANSIFLGALVFFVGLNIFYMIYSIQRDLYMNRAILTYSLPVKESKLVIAKIIEIGLMYLINLLALIISFKILKLNLHPYIRYYFLLGLIWDLLCAGIINFIMQVKRFKLDASYILYVVGLIAVIFLFGYLICKYFSFVIVNGSIQKAGPMDYAFLYPFAIGKMDIYKNITTLIYYILALFLVIFVNQLNLRDNIDL